MSDLPPLPTDGPEASRLEDLAARTEAERVEAARRLRGDQEEIRANSERVDNNAGRR